MSRYCLILLGILLGLCQAGRAVEDVSVLYNGEKDLPERLSMGFWGYRPVNLTEGNPFVPFRLAANRRYYGLKIVTMGRYEGVRFDFKEPLDLSPFVADKDVFLEIYFRSSLQGAGNPTTPITPPATYPGGGYPGGAYPGGAYPGGAYPGGAYPGGAYPGGAYDPGAYPPGTTPSGMYPPGAYPPGTTPPGAYDPGAYPPGTTPSGMYPPGAYPPGTTPSGMYPPGAYPPGTTPSGMYPPGTTPSGMYPPGTTPPGMYPPGTTPSGNTPSGMYPPGAYAANTTPSGMYPPGGTYPPGAYPPGTAGVDENDPPSMLSPYRRGTPSVYPTNNPAAIVPGLDNTVPSELSPGADQRALTVPLPQLKDLRITFYTDKGIGMLRVTPDQFYPKEEVNQFWVRIGIPLSQIQQGLPIGGKLYRIAITSENPAEFLIGRLAFVRDNDPIEASLLVYPPFLEAKKSIFFAVRVKAGLTPYEVQWNFDTQKDEKSVDAVGDRVTYTYPAEGVYSVTCTVRDVTGAKPPVTSVMGVKISRPFEE